MAAELTLHLSHLNQLLTCSLCNGLLKQATCLCCNHHFCMACILDFTSKTGSCCPKCKLPATKQQAKYSPEFDKIVAIYQSLELAAATPQICSPENMPELNYAGSGKENCKGKKKQKKQKRLYRETADHFSPCPVKVEMQPLPMLKRIQLPCPLSRGAVDHEEIVYSSDMMGSLTSEDVLNVRVDWSKDIPEKQELSKNMSEKHELSFQLAEPGIVKNSSAQMPKEQLCLPLEDVKGGLDIGNVVGIMAKLDGDSNVLDCYGDDSNIQHLKRQHSTLQSSPSPKCSTDSSSKQENSALDQVSCAFCQTSNDSLLTGPMMHYEKGVPVKAGKRIKSIVSVHLHCAEWAPNVYYVGDVAKNLVKEVARGQKLKCSCCGLKGAVLGCLVKRCVKSFHYPCARVLSCRWDDSNFLVLCPDHVSSRLPSDDMRVQAQDSEIDLKTSFGTLAQQESDHIIVNEKLSCISQVLCADGCEAARADKQATVAEPKMIAKISNKWSPNAACNWVLCGSGLKFKSYDLLASLATHCGAKFTRTWDPRVTHLITGTDETGAASRTFKFLMATLAGTWILRSEWLDACISACQPVREEPFEVNCDIHGMVGGPKHARLLAASRGQKLFEGLEFYLLGDYAAAYKEDLQALIKAAGGGLLNAHGDSTRAGNVQSSKVVVYNADVLPHATNGRRDCGALKRRWWEAKSLAGTVKAHVVGHTWILDSIAAYQLQPFR